eukprot:1139555-Pelagomonas_calceolata.AAC.3
MACMHTREVPVAPPYLSWQDNKVKSRQQEGRRAWGQFMDCPICTLQEGVVSTGSITTTRAEKVALAASSLEYNVRSPIFRCAMS